MKKIQWRLDMHQHIMFKLVLINWIYVVGTWDKQAACMVRVGTSSSLFEKKLLQIKFTSSSSTYCLGIVTTGQ